MKAKRRATKIQFGTGANVSVPDRPLNAAPQGNGNTWQWVFELDTNKASTADVSLKEPTSTTLVLRNNSTMPLPGTLRRNVFAALHEIVAKMASLSSGDPYSVDDLTAAEATKVLTWLSNFKNDPPKIMSHGGDAVTFKWDRGDIADYLTVMGNEFSELGIHKATKVKCEFDVELNDPEKRSEWLKSHGYEPLATSVQDDFY